jgi:hypothetical protein
MRYLRVLLDFIRFSIVGKIGFCRNVITIMTGNISFPNPEISLTDAKKLVDDLETAYLAAKDGSRTQASIMRDKEILVDDAFRKLANYVDRTADGNETMILSSGFNLSKKTNSYSKPDLNIKNGNVSGNVKLTAKSIEGAKSYIWQFVKNNLPLNGEGWLIAGYSTQATFEVANLDIASKYWFRVAGVTPSGTTDYCNALMKVVE